MVMMVVVMLEMMMMVVVVMMVEVMMMVVCLHQERCTSQGYPANSHHDIFPPWWVFVLDDNGGNLSGDKIPP